MPVAPLLNLASQPVAPAWAVFPLGGFTLVVVLWHLYAILRTDPSSIHPMRRRIRLANAAVMLTLVPLIAYAFGVATTDSPRLYAIAWLAVMGLLAIMVLLAMMDSANTARIHLADRGELRRQLRQSLRDSLPESPGRAR